MLVRSFEKLSIRNERVDTAADDKTSFRNSTDASGDSNTIKILKTKRFYESFSRVEGFALPD